MSRESCTVLKLGKEISYIEEKLLDRGTFLKWSPEAQVILLLPAMGVARLGSEFNSLEDIKCPEVNSIVRWNGIIWVIKAIRET